MLPKAPGPTQLAFRNIDRKLTEILRREFTERGRALILLRHEFHMMFLSYAGKETFTLAPSIHPDQNKVMLRDEDDTCYIAITIDHPGKHVLSSESGDRLGCETRCSDIADVNIQAVWAMVLQLASSFQSVGFEQCVSTTSPEEHVSVPFRHPLCDVIITIHPDVMAHKRG